jgi:hypothetical protein
MPLARLAVHLLFALGTLAPVAFLQDEPPGPPRGGPGGGFGGPMAEERELVKAHDKDKDGKLNAAERQAARAAIAAEQADGGGRRGGRRGPPRGMGGPGGPGGERESEPVKPGLRVDPQSVTPSTSKDLFDPFVLRTLFLDFEGDDWEKELADFYNSDVEVPAKLRVDGVTYPGVGVHFRGASSFFTVAEGHKRSLNVSIDFSDPKLRLLGAKTLNLLNVHADSSFMHAVLYSHVARRYIAAPRASFAKVVINGESWGVYVAAEQFDGDFVKRAFPGAKSGARWKVPGSPRGAGGLAYLGESKGEYEERYEIKSEDDSRSWKKLILLCKTLTETPLDELEAALAPMLDIDGALWFLALDVALINGDGYWVRASDYNLYCDAEGRFHLVPHDMNETFGPAMMPRFGRGQGRQRGADGPPESRPGTERQALPGAGIELDPLVGLDDATKPLRSRLLAVPRLRARYLECVRTIAEEWLDWRTLGPLVAKYRTAIEREVEADTRKLSSFAAFQAAVADAPAADDAARGRRGMALRAFADGRRRFLLEHPAVKGAAASRPAAPEEKRIR